MNRSLRILPLLLALVLASACACFAQSGFVKSGGQPIPGATITITQQGTTFSTVTDVDGHYTFPPLAPGAWSVKVEMFGFDPLTKSVDYGAVGEKPVNFDLELKQSQMLQRLQARQGVGGGQQPASGPTRQRGNASAGNNQQLDQQLQNELDAQTSGQAVAGNTGNANDAYLVSGSLSPGAAQGAEADSGPPGGGYGGFGAAGAGAGATDAAGNPVAAQFGQQGGGAGFGGGGGGFGGGGGGRGGGGFGGGGGGRGGGDRGAGQPRGQFGNFRRRNQQIRGQASFTILNSALNAKPFSLNGLDIPQAAYAQTRFSLIIGGPLVIPKLVKDPSTQFFLTYFGTRQRTPSLFTETVPTDLERMGNFSQATQSLGANDTNAPVVILNPTTHQPFPNNIIPVSQLNPIARALLGYYPQPSNTANANNYQFETAQPSNTDNVGFRLQRNVSKKNRLFLNIQYQRRDSETANAFGYADTTSGYGLSTTIGWTYNISPNLLSNFQFKFSRNRTDLVPYFSTVPDSTPIAGASTNPLSAGPPTLNFTNFASLSDGTASLRRNQSQGFTDALSLLRGVHNISFGGGYTRPDQALLSEPNGRGTFNFTGEATSALSASGQPVTGTGYDLADFLLGFPQSSSIQYSNENYYFLQNQFSLYAQDEWKVKSNFTAILGVRYEYFAPIHEKYGRLTNLDIANDFAAVSPVVAGATGAFSGAFPSGVVNSDWNNFSPRVAIAWKLTQFKKSTILRAGYGIYYNSQAYQNFASKLADQPPFATSNNINTSPLDVLKLNAGFLTTSPLATTNTFAVERNYRTPYVGTWDIFLQRDLGGGFFTEIGYTGTKGTGLDVYTLPNQGPSGNAAAVALRTQLGEAANYTLDQSVGNSTFNALQVRFNRRFNHGLSFQTFYQWAKAIDDSSTLGGGAQPVQNWLNIEGDKGLSNFDIRHTLTLNFVWTSPVGGPGSHISAESVKGRLLKDWQISGGITAHTGEPLTAKVLGNSQQLATTNGAGSERADATGLTISGGTGQFFNLNAFAVPAAGTFGTAGVNTITGPGLFSLNSAFARSFNISERRRIEFRIESNNTLNHVNYTSLYTTVNATNYGLPSAAGGMRTLDAVVRLRF